MPLIRRLPKRGFNNAAFHKTYALINLDALNAFEQGTTVNEQLLRERKLVRGNVAGLKILGDGELKHAISIEADKVSASARAKIESAGGTITLREQKRIEGPRHPAATAPASATAATTDAAPAAKKPSAKKSSKKKS